MSGVKEMKQVLRRCRRLGFTVTQTSKSHYRLELPGQPAVFVPSTPSDWRSVQNALAKIKRTLARAGLRWE